VNYQDRLLVHLAAYKRDMLGVSEPGIFRYRGRDVPKDHILPVAEKWLNILEPKRQLVREYLDQNQAVELHRYFHHLNSSQAFAFNLFIPFFEGGDDAAQMLLSALGQESGLISWEAESVPDAAEQTNLDAEWCTADGQRTICEVKLSEREFGTATDDDAHRAKLSELYEPALRGHVSPELLEPVAFFAAYQILRNVWHMLKAESNRLVFLMPRENAEVWAQLEATLAGVRLPARERIAVIAIEDLLGALCVDPDAPQEFREYSQELEGKYLPLPQLGVGTASDRLAAP